jgi:hypothetical protein
VRTFRAALATRLCLGAALTVQAQLSEAEKAAVLVGNHLDVETDIVYKVANSYEAMLDAYHPANTENRT